MCVCVCVCSARSKFFKKKMISRPKIFESGKTELTDWASQSQTVTHTLCCALVVHTHTHTHTPEECTGGGPPPPLLAWGAARVSSASTVGRRCTPPPHKRLRSTRTSRASSRSSRNTPPDSRSPGDTPCPPLRNEQPGLRNRSGSEPGALVSLSSPPPATRRKIKLYTLVIQSFFSK